MRLRKSLLFFSILALAFGGLLSFAGPVPAAISFPHTTLSTPAAKDVLTCTAGTPCTFTVPAAGTTGFPASAGHLWIKTGAGTSKSPAYMSYATTTGGNTFTGVVFVSTVDNNCATAGKCLTVAGDLITLPVISCPGTATTSSGSGQSIGQYPNLAGGSSSLSYACAVDTLTGLRGATQRFEDFPEAAWHFGAGRTISETSMASPGTTTLTATAAHFTSADINHGVACVSTTSLCINGTAPKNAVPPRAFIVSVGGTGCPTACTQATLNIPITTGAGTTGVGVGAALIVENSDGRSVADGRQISTTVVCSVTANFASNDLKRYLSGGNAGATPVSLPHLDAITSVGVLGSNGCLGTETSAVLTTATPVVTFPQIGMTLSISPAGYPCNPIQTAGACPASVQTVNGVAAQTTTTTRQVKDATFPSTTVLCSPTARFGQTDVNLPATSVGVNNYIGAGKWITAVSAGTGAAGDCPVPAAGVRNEATLNAAVTGGTANAVVAIGQPNVGAPTNGDAVVTNGSELDLNPSLVAGSDACTSNTPEGFNLSGKWFNPGSFGTAASGSPTDTHLNAPILGQFQYPTSVLTFAGYLLQTPASLAGDSQTEPHYDLVAPNIPTGIAVCATNDVGIGSVWKYSGFSPSEAATASGTGTPGTVSLRGLKDRGSASSTGVVFGSVQITAFLHIRTTNGTVDIVNGKASCSEIQPPAVDYPCGTG